jgi:hypothetical protein
MEADGLLLLSCTALKNTQRCHSAASVGQRFVFGFVHIQLRLASPICAFRLVALEFPMTRLTAVIAANRMGSSLSSALTGPSL